MRWAYGIGTGALSIGVLVRYLSGIWTRDRINRADLNGNMSVLENLRKDNESLRADNANLRRERDDWQRRYYECYTGDNG